MIPKRIRDRAYRLKRERRSEHCEIENTGRWFVVHLDHETVKLARSRRAERRV